MIYFEWLRFFRQCTIIATDHGSRFRELSHKIKKAACVYLTISHVPLRNGDAPMYRTYKAPTTNIGQTVSPCEAVSQLDLEAMVVMLRVCSVPLKSFLIRMVSEI